MIDLGSQYIASIFVADGAPASVCRPYPLEVVRCARPGGCGLVQLRHTISPDVLYSDYGYRSGTNELMRANLRGIVTAVEQMLDLRAGDTVVDIGCNDGTLLDSYACAGLDRIGFDPAKNVARLAAARGIEVIQDYFSHAAFARARPGRKARVVTSIAMLYDLEKPLDFFADIVAMLADDGVWVIELSYLPFMLQRRSFDTICHEHLEYYGLRQLEWMIARSGLAVHRVEFNDVNGGSFRLFVRRRAVGSVPEETAEMLARVRAQEQGLGLDSDAPYEDFCGAVEGIRADLKRLLIDLKRQGMRVYAYGASTKGNTILQYCGIDRDLLQKAADRNPEKWGRHTLGTDIPIVSEEQARAEAPDYFLVLPWHFFEGFIRREAEFLRRGGKFILPLPTVRIVGEGEIREGALSPWRPDLWPHGPCP